MFPRIADARTTLASIRANIKHNSYYYIGYPITYCAIVHNVIFVSDCIVFQIKGFLSHRWVRFESMYIMYVDDI